MRTEITTRELFTFEELEPQAQQKALESCWDWNVSEEWWESTYEDAANVGLKITHFDADRQDIGIKLKEWADVFDVVRLIAENHGEDCGTFKAATEFNKDYATLVAKHSDGVTLEKVAEDNEHDFDNDLEELEKDFLKTMGEEYLSILRKEYDYQTSEEAIKESIEANEVEFLEDGTKA